MMLSDEELERYARHIVLREVGGPGQARLRAASALVVGAGGLGGPVAMYLAAAGVGRLVLMDADTVSLSNLQRQIQFASADIGRPKAEAAAERLSAINPHVVVEARAEMLTEANAAAALAGMDLALDGLDSYSARFALNAARHAARIPMVSGAIERFAGQVAVFDSGRTPGAPCYRCLVREAPPDADTCAQVGVVGAMAGLVGSWMALEAIKILAGAGEPLTGRLLMIDGLAGEARTARLSADPECPVCGG